LLKRKLWIYINITILAMYYRFAIKNALQLSSATNTSTKIA